MSQDALERLRNKVKPIVENRDLSSTNSSSEGIEEKETKQANTATSRNLDVEISTLQDNKNSPLHLSSSRQESMELETKQTTIRLEKGLNQRLSQKCQIEEISREVFIEALFVQFEKNQSSQSKILKEARQRDEQRKKIANYRRAKSMIEKFGID